MVTIKTINKMQLNNAVTNEIFKISEVKSLNRVVGILYDNSLIGAKKEVLLDVSKSDLAQLADNTLTIEENLHEAIYEYLLTLPEFSDFAISYGNFKNWLVEDRPNRIIANSQVVVREQAKNTAAGQVFTRVQTQHAGFIFPSNSTICVYVEDMDSGDAEILAPFIPEFIFKENIND